MRYQPKLRYCPSRLPWQLLGAAMAICCAASRGEEGLEDLSILLAWLALSDNIHIARLELGQLFVGNVSDQSDGGLVSTQSVPCPFVASTPHCTDNYWSRISCTPAIWQRIVGGPGGPTELYHIVCRWNVRRIKITSFTSHRTRWDRFWGFRACARWRTRTVANFVARKNHYQVSVGPVAVLPAPFRANC